jgi:MFS family permease
VIRAAVIDLTPLRISPTFRRLYLGSMASSLGSSLTRFAVLFQVWEITRNPVATGTLALLGAIPLLLLAPFGGTMADRSDRRTIMLVTAAGNAVVVAALAAQALLVSDSTLLLYLLVTAQGCLSALGSPAREAILPTLVGPKQVAAARALNTFSWQFTLLAGPALAGLLAGHWGVRACYLVDLLSYLFGFLGIAGLPRIRLNATPQPHLRAMVDGLGLAVRHRPLLAAFSLDAALTTLAFPIGLLPALNAHLGGTVSTLGYLMSCLAIGGVGSTLVSGTITNSASPGAAMYVMAFVWCAAVIALGLAPTMPIAMTAMMLWGAADILLGIPRGTLVQLTTPDAYRGRLSAANHIVGQGGPAIGDLRGGLLATTIGAGPALAIGGVCAALVTAVVAKKLPEARTFTLREPPN